jgi:hypothetical protein
MSERPESIPCWTSVRPRMSRFASVLAMALCRVPEPTALPLLAIGGVVLLRRRQHRRLEANRSAGGDLR